MEGIPKISILGIEIIDSTNIICHTEKQKFTDAELYFISQDIICLALRAQDRHIYMIGKVGKRDDFSSIERINLSYTDSGAVNVKCGILILMRTKITLEKIETRRFLPSEIEDKEFVRFLENTQLVADYFE